MNQKERQLVYLFAGVIITLASMSHLLEGYLDFGAPGTGFHSIRLCGLAVVDTSGVAGVALVISLFKGWKWHVVFMILVLISIPVHLIFGIKTALVAPIYH